MWDTLSQRCFNITYLSERKWIKSIWNVLEINNKNMIIYIHFFWVILKMTEHLIQFHVPDSSGTLLSYSLPTHSEWYYTLHFSQQVLVRLNNSALHGILFWQTERTNTGAGVNALLQCLNFFLLGLVLSFIANRYIKSFDELLDKSFFWNLFVFYRNDIINRWPV